jgi:hypothetical protein
VLRPPEYPDTKQKPRRNAGSSRGCGTRHRHHGAVEFILQIEHGRPSRMLPPIGVLPRLSTPGGPEQEADPDRNRKNGHWPRANCFFNALAKVVGHFENRIRRLMAFFRDDVLKTISNALNALLHVAERLAAAVTDELGHLLRKTREVVPKFMQVTLDIVDGRRRTPFSRRHEMLL